MQTTSENSKPEISCIYVNYRSAKYLERSLESLFLSEKETPFEVIIVNNDQNEKKKIEELGEKYQARILEAFHNPGFGAAVNLGAEQSRGNLLFCINPDTEWKESFFPAILEQFKERQDIGVIGIQLISPIGTPESKEVNTILGSRGLPWSSSVLHWVSGGALFIPKTLFREVGGFDERFFMYFEDMDLCVRVQKAGHCVLFDKAHAIIHLGGKSHITKKSQKEVYDRSLYLYSKKHWPLAISFIFRILHPFYRFLFPYGRK